MAAELPIISPHSSPPVEGQVRYWSPRVVPPPSDSLCLLSPWSWGFFLPCLGWPPGFWDHHLGHTTALRPNRGGVVPTSPSLVPIPLPPGRLLQPVRLPAQSPDPPSKLKHVGRWLAWWGRGLLLKGAGRGSPAAPGWEGARVERCLCGSPRWSVRRQLVVAWKTSRT